MNFSMTDKTKKGLMIGGAAAVLFLGGFGGGFAFGKNQDNAGRDRFDRREVMRDDSFGGFDSDMDDDFFFEGEDEDFGMNRKGRSRGRTFDDFEDFDDFGDFDDFEGFDFDFDDEDFESGRDSSRSGRRSRMMDEDSRSGATEDEGTAREKSSKDKTSEDAAKDNAKDSTSKDKTSDSKTDKENV